MTQYRIRLAVAVSTSSAVPALVGVMVGLVVARAGGPPWLAVVIGCVLAVGYGVLTVRQVRRRSLTVTDDALVVQRDKYRLIVPWQGITGVQRRRHQVVMLVEELLCTGASVEAIDSSGRPSALPSGLEAHPALTRVMVSLYAKDWRQGPIGDRVRALGVEG